MRYLIDIDKVKKEYKFNEEKMTLQHNTGRSISILPYTTQYKEAFKSKIMHFNSSVGEFSRKITNKKEYKDDVNEELFKNIMGNVELEEKDKSAFKSMIKELFFNKQGIIEIFHPSVINYIKIDDISNKKIGQFLFDVLCTLDDEVSDKLKKAYVNDPSNILLKLVVSSLPELQNRNKEESSLYKNFMPYISELFMEDFKFMLDNPSFYMESLDKLLKYYYFFYVSQLSINLNRMFDAEINKPNEIYFNLDWENTSKSRISYNHGWRIVESAVPTLFSHANCLELINHSNCEGSFSYKEIKNIVEGMNEEEKEEFANSLNNLITEYKRYITDGDWEKFENVENYKDNIIYNKIYELYRAINHQFVNSGRKGRQSDYSSWFVEFCKLNFLRRRGPLGYTLNLTEDYLIFITKLCIKDREKLKLKDLFKEYERRGIYFDRDSLNKIIQLFEKLNILEKKSDSGDAQYVKSIL